MAGGSKNGIFVFDEFRLDTAKLMLYQGDREVIIPPKVAKILQALVESAGEIISKDELMERVWDDSVVEESNVTQALYRLRKIFGNMPDGRPYIETLRRRGYRFNGAVGQLKDEPDPTPKLSHATEPAPSIVGVEREGNVLRLVDWKPAEATEVAKPSIPAPAEPRSSSSRRWGRAAGLALAAFLLLIIGGGGFFVLPKLMPAATNAESQPELVFVKLTNGLFPFGATISPDGNAFVYHETDGETDRMYVQQTGQSSRIEIASSSALAYSSKTFTPDGKYVFYVAIDKKTRLVSLFKIPTMGGGSVKVIDDVLGGVSFSPDGKEMVFPRWNPATSTTSLLISGSDGKAPRVILERTRPQLLLSSAAWSPDGKGIAFADRDAKPGEKPASYRINLLDIATGKITNLSSENWENVLRLTWSPDGKGVFAIATRDGDGYTPRRDQLYFVSYPGGVSHRLTNEGNRHETNSLSVSNNGEVFSVTSNRSCQMWVMNSDGNPNSATQITRGFADGRAGIAVLPDGRFAFLARSADGLSLMLANADASNVTQIATGFSFVEELRADPNGRFFVFSSKPDGEHGVYRIDVDGSNLVKLAGDREAIDSSVSPDGSHVVYDYVIDGNELANYALKQVTADGSDSVLLVKGCYVPVHSPDGSMISCVTTGRRSEILIVSAKDGGEIERHPLPPSATTNFGIGWTTDGSGLVYISTEKDVSNLWVQPRDRGKARQLTNFTSGVIYRYAYSPDGSKIYLARGYPMQDAFVIRNFRQPRP